MCPFSACVHVLCSCGGFQNLCHVIGSASFMWVTPPELQCSAVSESCEKSVHPGTELDLGDISILMSSMQFSTEDRRRIRATVTF